MKAWQLTESKKFASIDIDFPSAPRAGEAKIRTLRMGICGTDISCYHGKFPFFDYPRIPGHELGVEVLEVGEGVENVKPGDVCSVEPYLNCGQCYACNKGQGNCCQNLKVFGVMMDGGLCEQSLIRADKLHTSSKLSPEQLALVETLAIGCHASDRGNPQKGENILVIGANLFDLVTDATGNQHSMGGALQYVAHTGRLVYVGITTENISFPHPVLHRPEITLLASRNALPKDFPRIIELIENGTINTDPWITHHIEFNEVAERFEEVTHPSSGALKAVIHVAD
ncbi:MAG: L-iditol 2-dehydrogenase [Proteobacteria bacterium]|nr:L-iditol 2-dehydrogenase [Pseudomonadota bacterium]